MVNRSLRIKIFTIITLIISLAITGFLIFRAHRQQQEAAIIKRMLSGVPEPIPIYPNLKHLSTAFFCGTNGSRDIFWFSSPDKPEQIIKFYSQNLSSNDNGCRLEKVSLENDQEVDLVVLRYLCGKELWKIHIFEKDQKTYMKIVLTFQLD